MDNRLYLFVSTKNGALAAKCASLEAPSFTRVISDAKNGAAAYFYTARAGGSSPYYLGIINDQKDYSVETEIQRLLTNGGAPADSESLLSFAHAADNRFVAASDLWGIQHHCYYHDDDSFLCSNSLFLLSSILGSRLSEAALFEYLFFNFPMRETTWFDNIRMLGPGRAVVFDWGTRKLTITPPVDLYQRMTALAEDTDPASAAAAFFGKVAKALGEEKACIGLSAGSDSRTVLSGLLKYGLLDHAVSFGREDFAETHAIKRFTGEMGIRSVFHNLPDLHTDWNDSFIRGEIVTNGLLHPSRVHYVKHYGQVKGTAWFEGYLGSEIVKGEIAAAVASTHHAAVIRDNRAVRDVVNSDFGFLPSEFRSKMESSISNAHQALLTPIESNEGKKQFASFIFDMCPSKVFGGLINLAGRRMKTYYLFLSPRVIRTLGTRYGVVGYNSLLRSFPGGIKDIVPEAEIVKRFDTRLYESRLDRLVSFKEALELPLAVSYPIWGARRLEEKLTTRQYHHGQTDPKEPRGYIKAFVDEHPDEFIDGFFEGKLEGETLLRERAKIACLRLIAAKPAASLIEYLTRE